MSKEISLSELEKRASRIVDAAIKSGADACDCVVASGQSLSVNVRDGVVENTERSESDEFSLRVFTEGKVATVNANQAEEIESICERAVAMARVSPVDPYAGLAPETLLCNNIPQLDLFDPSIPLSEDLADSAMVCEAAGLKTPGVDKSLGAGAGWGRAGFVLATSAGFSGSFNMSRHSISAGMIAGSGTQMERDYDFHSAVYRDDLRNSEDVGRVTGERTVRKVNPRQVKSGAFPIIFDQRIASGILSALAGAINGTSIARKSSFLRDDMGSQIFPQSVNIICDPLRDRGLGSRPVDGEGIATSRLDLINNGVLKQWVLDCATARELELETNARATRSGASVTPSTTNLYMENGEISLDAMIGDISQGLLVTSTIGHGINMVSGDYSKGANGFWIENGEIAFPVSEITIAGNLKDMFAHVTPANDLVFNGATNAPSLKIEGMTIGGK